MSATQYFDKASAVLRRIEETQLDQIRAAGSLFAEVIAAGRLVHMFGSGHSVIPVMDIFPRYGAYPGFHPIQDPRLMWIGATGPGGAPELLWLERREGYVRHFLESFVLDPSDAMLVFSHGGLNAAPVEVAQIAREKGLKTVVVTSVQNHRTRQATHSTGKKLADWGDIVIDNCCPPDDAVVAVPGVTGPVAATSTLAAVYISMALVAETASQLAIRGHHVRPFVSPNVTEAPPDNNDRVYAEYRQRIRGIRN
jgi:uncharacterized phosphosugar-binding protein